MCFPPPLTTVAFRPVIYRYPKSPLIEVAITARVEEPDGSCAV